MCGRIIILNENPLKGALIYGYKTRFLIKYIKVILWENIETHRKRNMLSWAKIHNTYKEIGNRFNRLIDLIRRVSTS